MSDDQVHHLSIGVWVIFLAVGIAVIGTYVGVACARRASFAPTRTLLWTLLSATSTAIVTFWLPNVVLMAGFSVDGSTVRFDPVRMVISLVLCLVAVLAGLTIVSRRIGRGEGAGDARILTVMGAALVTGLGVSGGYYLSMTAIEVQGRTYMDAALIAVAVAIAVIASIGVLWMCVADVPRSVLAGGSVAVALAPLLMHAAMMSALRVRLDAGSATPPGAELFTVLFPGFVLGMLVLTVPIAALLMAPDRATAELEARARTWSQREVEHH
ncbi:MHYT domain-containing protein [Rhodococcus triatomae]|nr:hypothetical protein G419_23794 [Rhodococcus triatomae BKS 15-14]